MRYIAVSLLMLISREINISFLTFYIHKIIVKFVLDILFSKNDKKVRINGFSILNVFPWIELGSNSARKALRLITH